MTNPLRPMALLAVCASAPLCLPTVSAAADVAWNLGLRASVYDENYKMGVGGEAGAVMTSSEKWDLGLHLNYSHFAPKTENWEAADEFGGYVGAYYKPKIDQAFWLRIGPHIGYANVVEHYVDIGGDVMAIFKATPSLDIYGAFVPSFFAGKNGQTLFRVGLGIEYHSPR